MNKKKERTKEEREELVHKLWYDLTYEQIKALISIYTSTNSSRQYMECMPSLKINMADLINFWLVEWKNDPLIDVLDKDWKDIYRYSKFRITPKWATLYNTIMRKIKEERGLTLREKLVKWSGKQAPIRPFLALIISILSLIVSVVALYRSF